MPRLRPGFVEIKHPDIADTAQVHERLIDHYAERGWSVVEQDAAAAPSSTVRPPTPTPTSSTASPATPSTD